MDLSSLFAVKKKPTKKMKISLETEGADEPEILVQKSENIKSKIELEPSKLDYAFEETTTEVDTSNRISKEITSAINEYDTEFDRDHLTRRKETLKRSKELANKGELDTKYRGLKGYQQFLMQGDTAKANAGSDKNRVAGPVRASANLRVTSRFDYKPDLCKDYNETGFCGFGDSCIFLHDRTEHKSSYDLEREWDAEVKRKELEKDNEESMVKEIVQVLKPTHCTVCSKLFTRPVKTKCAHFFCEGCVLRLTKCPTCKAALLGSFKPAAKELN